MASGIYAHSGKRHQFNSIPEAAHRVTGHRPSIHKAINGRGHTAPGHEWEYA